jgi:pimeloyl-ACP methyl ester carboxylesterase
MTKDFVLKTQDNEVLRVTTYGHEYINSSPCIFLVHGFKGFKDWGFFPYVGKYFAENKYFVIFFNFSLNGVGKSLVEFDELDKFAENTISREVDELSMIVAEYKNGFFGKTDNSKIGILGHSRGGGVSILYAAREKEVPALVTWASVSYYDRYTEREKNEWRQKDHIEVLNSRTNQLMRLDKTLLEDIEFNKKDKLNVEKAVGNLDCPFLLIHGEEDLTVPILEGEKLYNSSNKNLTQFIKIPSTGHTLNAKHPFEGSNSKLDYALQKSLEFFNKNLIN